MKILAISGSLQSQSSNGALIAAAADGASSGVRVARSISTGEIPPFNPDLEDEGRPAPPSSVAVIRAQVAEADGVLIATPEYAHSLPGALKNALDWLVGSGELDGEPVAVGERRLGHQGMNKGAP
jgi:chromate reductase, NAD(P)H dehydrogenase (quinone)